MNDIVIKVKNLKKVYKTDGGTVTALKGVNFEIKKGDMIAIMGPSGSGKSTLLHLIGGVDFPTEGDIFIAGRNINNFDDEKLSKFRNENIGFVFQFHYLLPEFTAFENVAIPLQIANKKNFKDKVLETLTLLGLKERINHLPSELSGGEQQRVAIGRAIINNPKILIADEPTGNLDSENAKNVIMLFKKLNQEYNMTVIIATHDIEIAKYCNYIYFLRDGLIEKIEKI